MLAWLGRLPDGHAANDEHAAELRAIGVPDDQITAALEKAAEFQDQDDTGEVVVWAENWNIVQVFTRCQWQRSVLSGMAGAVRVWEGISAQEVRAACDLLDIPRAEWPDLMWGIAEMVRTAQPLLNEGG